MTAAPVDSVRQPRPSGAPAGSPARPPVARLAGLGLAALPLGVVTFSLVVTGLALGIGTLVLIVGAPILYGALLVGESLAGVWRRLLRWSIDADIPEPEGWGPAEATFLARLSRRLRAPRTYLEAVFNVLVALPAGIVLFVVSVVAWIAAFPVARQVIGALARGLAALSRPLLSGTTGTRRQLEARVAHLSETRARSVDAAQAERKRIERDLHDGAQARLVGLAMELGRARERLARGAGTDEAAAMVAEAHEESKRALAELRALVRGIHPVVLGDRGLDAALSSLAAASPVPVEVGVLLDPSPGQAIETIAYFVVAEALTNVARHSGASRAEVSVVRDGDLVRVRVADDGRGGADPSGGTGLAGLADRVASVDGSLTMTSPPGRGTTVEVVLPCVS